MIGAIILFTFFYFLIGSLIVLLIYAILTQTDRIWNLEKIFDNASDNKYAVFWVFVFWPFVTLKYVCIGLWYGLKFVINAIGWAIANIFKL